MSEPESAPRHPRDDTHLERIDAQAQAFEAALARGRLHHAWLLTGPQGLGKASFAYRTARLLLGGGGSGGRLAPSADHAVSRMVAARSHPDLLVLERHVESGPARKSIPVDEARRLPEFFSKAPALSPCRVAIIDAADDLNVNAANAVLKTLEEPSGHGVLLLVSHAPGRLLTTIRSRCRQLAFAPWPEAALAEFARSQLDVGDGEALRLAGMAKGTPGRLLALAGSAALDLDAAAAALLGALEGAAADSPALKLADSLRGGEGAQTFAVLMERLGERLHAAALQAVDSATAETWASLWRRVSDLPGRVEALNLDRTDAFWTLRAELRAAVRVQGAPC